MNVILSEEAERFLTQESTAVRQKFDTAIQKTVAGFKGNWFKKLADTDGIFEFRVEVATNIYRLLAFWDTRDVKHTLIVCTHGFQKKTNKTPPTQIERATRIKHAYFATT